MSRLPITLRVDTRQFDWGTLILVSACLAVLCLPGASSHWFQLAIPARLIIATWPAAAILAYLAGRLALGRHDYIIVSPSTLTISSNLRTQEWSWHQIDDVQLHVVHGKFPYKIVRLYIPDAGDRFINLPRFLCSDEGPETPNTIYELVHQVLDNSRNRQP